MSRANSDFVKKAMNQAIDTLNCQGIIMIPVYDSPDNAPNGVQVPVIHGGIDIETVDRLLNEAGKVARKNLTKRKQAEKTIHPVTPMFNTKVLPTA